MSKHKLSNLKIYPDDRLQLITGQIFVGHGVLLAYELGVLKLICDKPFSIQAISRRLKLKQRVIQALISCASVLNLVHYSDKGYKLTPLGNSYFNPKNNVYYGNVLDLLIKEHKIMNYSTIKKSILTNKPQIDKNKPLFIKNNDLGSSNDFINALHHKAFQPAFFWPNILDLSTHKNFIDLGGGSGIHTIAACLKYPNLNGIVCDRKKVIPITKKYIKKFHLNNRIDCLQLDIWQDLYPYGDIYFFGDVFHDWNKTKCLFLIKKCYKFLPRKGKIILHEMLFNKNKTKPFLTAAYNIKMLLWTEGQQYSKFEIRSLLKKGGFKNIRIVKSLGTWSLIIGEKV